LNRISLDLAYTRNTTDRPVWNLFLSKG